jgi:hypothetical protein
MGFLDRVKASFGQAVGGTTTLQLELEQTTLAPGAALAYRIVLVASGPLKAARITVGLYGRERVRIWIGAPPALAPPAGEVPLSERALSPSAAAHETITFQQVDTLATAELALPAGQSREYRGQIQVPQAAQPTYRGVDAQHTWWVRAVVEIPLGADIVEELEINVH